MEMRKTNKRISRININESAELIKIMPTPADNNGNPIVNKVANYTCSGCNGKYNSVQTLSVHFKTYNDIITKLDSFEKCT